MNSIIPSWGTESTTMDENYPILPEGYKTWTQVRILTFIIALVGLLGNAGVLWILGFRLKRNSFSIYILNLAGADVIILLVEIFFFLEEFIDSFQHISQYFSIVWTFAYLSHLSILSCISTERCLSVLFPSWYRCLRPRHTSAVICALLWILSLLLNILEGKLCGLLFHNLSDDHCAGFQIFLSAWVLLLLVILFVFNIILLMKMFCGFHRKKLTRFYASILLTVLIFLLWTLPVSIYEFLPLWITIPFPMLPLHWALLLLCINSSANPIIYFFVGSFRQRLWQRQLTLKIVLQRVLQDDVEVEEHGRNLPQEPVQRSGNKQCGVALRVLSLEIPD
ncbi:PREDICTED: mas-related G-protein coupled receptor member X2-like [Elephantulus edwardii]|uniref:mas-related G-protein coupled receptor member X2-like n=1 Tax=Elephantulus edwardii TaxID=28737 RepID=UPI0003F0B353|nr:PREDICTED: mas-related G-protein coupled receptor member X2-like [Elephantulus edwardii]